MKQLRKWSLIGTGIALLVAILLTPIIIWAIPKTESGAFDHPIDVFFIVILWGCCGGIGIGLLLNLALEEWDKGR